MRLSMMVRNGVPGLREVLRQAVHFDVAVVADQQLLVLVEHAQALGHLGQRRIEQAVLLAQLRIAHVERRQRAFGPFARVHRLLEVYLRRFQGFAVVRYMRGAAEHAARRVGAAAPGR